MRMVTNVKRLILALTLFISSWLAAQCAPNTAIVGIQQVNSAATMAPLLTKFDIDDWNPLHEAVVRDDTPLIYMLHSASLAADQLIAGITGQQGVVYVYKDCKTHVHTLSTPNDTYYSADQPDMPIISAPAAWNITTGCRSGAACPIIADLDTGLDYNHPDIAANVWSAPTSFTLTGINGATLNCPAGTHGIDVCAKTCDPLGFGGYSAQGHGTEVSGVIGAVGNNSYGVTGVMQQAQLLQIRWLEGGACTGSNAEMYGALDALIQLKALFPNLIVANHSYYFNEEDNGTGSDGSTFADNAGLYTIWQDLTSITGLTEVLAAGNGVAQNGGDAGTIGSPTILIPYTTPLPAVQPGGGTQASPLQAHFWPQSFMLPNMVNVANTNNLDQSGWTGTGTYGSDPASCYGSSAVQLGAPGTNITTPTYEGYGSDSTLNFSGPPLGGTSLSSPLVAGTIALEAIAAPSLMQNGAALVQALLAGVDTGAALNASSNLSGLVSTNGRLNVYGAIVKAQQAASPTSGFSKWSPFFGKATTW